MSHKTP